MSETTFFLSYAHADELWARELAEALRALGAEVWFEPWSVPVGNNIADAVEQGFRQADFVLFLVSPASVQSPTLAFELGAAVGMGKRLAAVVSDGVDLVHLPAPLLTRKYIVNRSPREAAQEIVGQTGTALAKA